MADLSDVNAALVALIAATVYANGSGAPPIGSNDVTVYAGWPIPAKLDADMAKTPSTSHISVFNRPEEQNVTRFDSNDWQEISRNTATLVMATSGQVITLGGVIGPASNPQNIMALINSKPYVYAVQPTDTLLVALTALANLIAADFPMLTTQGLTITLPANARCAAARVGVTGVVQREVGRQNKDFQITIWAALPATRAALGKLLTPALAATQWLNLPDGTRGRLIYKASTDTDEQQRQRVYRRDFLYHVEYATTQTIVATEITQQQTNVEASIAGTPPIPVASVFS